MPRDPYHVNQPESQRYHVNQPRQSIHDPNMDASGFPRKPQPVKTFPVSPVQPATQPIPHTPKAQPARPQQPSFVMPTFEMPEMPDYSAMMAEYQENLRIAQETAELEGLWSQRTASVEQAITDVDEMVNQWRSHAAMTGQDFAFDEAGRDTMIMNLFADYFPMEVESRIQELIGSLGFGEQDPYSGAIGRGTEGTFEGKLGSIAELNRLQEVNRGALAQTVLTGGTEDTLEQETILG